MVPRFHFDVREDGKAIPDQVGLECEGLDAAEEAAIEAAAEIGRERLPQGEVREVTVEVRDADGFLLLTATVSLAVRRTVRALA